MPRHPHLAVSCAFLLLCACSTTPHPVTSTSRPQAAVTAPVWRGVALLNEPVAWPGKAELDVIVVDLANDTAIAHADLTVAVAAQIAFSLPVVASADHASLAWRVVLRDADGRLRHAGERLTPLDPATVTRIPLRRIDTP